MEITLDQLDHVGGRKDVLSDDVVEAAAVVRQDLRVVGVTVLHLLLQGSPELPGREEVVAPLTTTSRLLGASRRTVG